MLTTLGVLCILFALAMVFVQPLLRKEAIETGTGHYKQILDPHPTILTMWNSKRRSLLAFIGLFLILVSNAFFIARESKQYYVLNKANGNRSAVMAPGLHFITPFVTEVREWDKYLEIKGIPINKEGESIIEEDKLSQIEGPINGGVSVRFIDRVTADVYPSVRFLIPSDEKQFIKIVEKYRTQENLTMNTLIPTVSEQLKNVTFMFTADDYVSGGAVTYRAEIEDVLRNGSYIFNKEQVKDTIYAELSMLGDTTKVVNRKRNIREIKTYEKNSKILKNGIPIRKAHEINDNNIIVDQVIIDGIVLETEYEKKLKQQRDLAATAIVEGQKIATAKVAQLRVIAEGERDKASERVKQEKDQITKLITIETSVKEEESKRQLAEINVKTEELKARATKIAADAESYKNAKLVQAGLTPLEKANIEKDTKIGVAREIAKMNVPTTVITGGNGSNPTEALLQSKLIKDLTGKD